MAFTKGAIKCDTTEKTAGSNVKQNKTNPLKLFQCSDYGLKLNHMKSE